MTLQQKKDYLNKRRAKFPDTPLNDDELSFLYGYKDDEVMRQELLIKAEAKGGVTELDLKYASPAIRKEFRDANLVKPDDGQTLSNLSQISTEQRKKVTDLVANSAKATGTLDAKPLQYYSLLDATEDILYQYQVEVLDPDDTEFNFTLYSYPEGMDVNESGLITWLPTEGILSSDIVIIQVSDGGENLASPYIQTIEI